jgi:hypothetical protein
VSDVHVSVGCECHGCTVVFVAGGALVSYSREILLPVVLRRVAFLMLLLVGTVLFACSADELGVVENTTPELPVPEPTSTPVPTRVPVVVVILDPSLQAAVRVALDKPTSDITDLDILGLTEFAAPGQGISDITGLEYTTNLTTFNVWVNRLSDISIVAGLTNLTSLSLGRLEIIDISAVSGLANLETLQLTDNRITDISPLSGMTLLKKLQLTGNGISDISPLLD